MLGGGAVGGNPLGGKMRFEVIGNSLDFFLDNVRVVGLTNASLPMAGTIGMRSCVNSTIDNFTAKPVETAWVAAMKTKLLTFEIPEELDRVPEWIDAHLMGLDLHQVVTELRVMGAGPEESVVTLEDVLGDKLEAVLQHGLRSLSQAQLRQLIGRPQLLVELQNLVLDEGGEYWATVPHSDEVVANTKKTWA